MKWYLWLAIVFACYWGIDTIKADSVTINVPDNATYQTPYVGVYETNTYTFNLNTAFFNASPYTPHQNGSIWEANINGHVIEQGDISAENSYSILVEYNQTWAVHAIFTYTPKPLGRWNAITDISVFNGSTLVDSCHDERGTYRGSRLGAPELKLGPCKG